MAEPQIDPGDPGDDTGVTNASHADSVHGPVVQTGSADTVNVYYTSVARLTDMSDIELRDKLLKSQDKLIESQKNHVEDLQKLEKIHIQQFHDLNVQFDKVKSLLPPLLQLVAWLDRDLRRVHAERAELSGKLDQVVNEKEEFRVRLEALTSYQSDVEVQRARVSSALHEVRAEENTVQRLTHALRTRWFVFFPDRAEPEVPQDSSYTSRFELMAKPENDADVLAYCRRVLAEVHAIQVEVQRALEELADGVFKTGRAEAEDLAAAASHRSEADFAIQRKLALAERKLREVEQEKRKDDQRRSRSAPEARAMGTNGLLPGVGLFLVGLLIREVLKMQALSDNQQVFLTVLTVVLVGLPCRSLLKWSRTVDSPAPETVALACLLCVVAGYFSWVVALIPALAALSSVVIAKRVGAGFVLVALATVVLGISLPRFMFWSWTGVDWVAALF
jgi:hypothetical protein